MKTPMTDLHRRAFLKGAAGTAMTFTAAVSTAATAVAAAAEVKPKRNPISIFTKCFESLDYAAYAETVAGLGVDGVEATIRPGGHIPPEKVEVELPKMVAALKQRGLELTIMTTSITGTQDALGVKQLRTAAALGIRRYRLGYLRYDLTKPVLAQIDALRPQLKELAALNAELGLQAVYQNHSGRGYVGASLWDLQRLFEGLDARHMAVAFDLGHATAEGMGSWEVQFNVIRPHLGVVYVKNFRWTNNRQEWVPLADGVVDRKFLKSLVQSGYTGPINLHEEYIDHRDPKLVPRHVEAYQRDLATLKQWLA